MRSSRPAPEVGARALILLGAFVSFALSVVLWFGGDQQQGIFLGLWVPFDRVARRTRSAAPRAMSTAGLFVVGVLVTLIVAPRSRC